MNFKQQGQEVHPILFKKEERWIEKVVGILNVIALLPCGQKERAKETARSLNELLGELAKQDNVGEQEEPLQ